MQGPVRLVVGEKPINRISVSSCLEWKVRRAELTVDMIEPTTTFAPSAPLFCLLQNFSPRTHLHPYLPGDGLDKVGVLVDPTCGGEPGVGVMLRRHWHRSNLQTTL